jgi:hypothetical protein
VTLSVFRVFHLPSGPRIFIAIALLLDIGLGSLHIQR